MERVVIRIVARHDSPYDFAARASEKKRGIAVFVKRVLPTKKLFALDQERRHPRRIVRIDSPWKLDERIAFGTRLDLGYFYLRHDSNLVLCVARAPAQEAEILKRGSKNGRSKTAAPSLAAWENLSSNG